MHSEASLRTRQLSQQLAGRIAADPAFAARLQAIPADLPPEEVLARVLDIVRSGGIDLSVDDLATLQTQHSSPASSGEELSEDDLEGLSGGVWGVDTAMSMLKTALPGFFNESFTNTLKQTAGTVADATREVFQKKS